MGKQSKLRQARQMQKSLQPSSYAMAKSILNNVSDTDKAELEAIPLHLHAIMGAKSYELGYNERGNDDTLMQNAMEEFRNQLVYLNLLCSQIDTLNAANIKGKPLQDILSGGLRDEIAAAYTDVQENWEKWRNFALRVSKRDIGALKTTRPDIAQSATEHLEALDKLKQGDCAAVYQLKPINRDITNLLEPAAKRKGGKSKLDGLRERWRLYEKEYPAAKTSEVVAALLAELADGNIKDGFREKLGLSEEQKTWFKRLKDSALKNPTGYRFDLFNRTKTSE